MPTFLTNGRMEPELAARIEARVRGRRHTPRPLEARERRARWRPRLVGLARAGVALALLGTLWLVLAHMTRQATELERSREALALTARAASASLTREDLGREGRIEAWLMRAATGDEPDVIADRVRPAGALAELLAHAEGAVYVRGARAALGTSGGIAAAAEESVKDAFLACLFTPPATRAEPALLAKVHAVYAGDAFARDGQTARLRELQLGLPFLVPSWAETASRAASFDDLARLRRAFDRAPIVPATRAAKAELLVFAIDEPSDDPGPTELDGERAHAVQVGLVDLASDTLVLRLRRRVDPSGIPPEKRPLYARGIDDCALAFDVRQAVTERR